MPKWVIVALAGAQHVLAARAQPRVRHGARQAGGRRVAEGGEEEKYLVWSIRKRRPATQQQWGRVLKIDLWS